MQITTTQCYYYLFELNEIIFTSTTMPKVRVCGLRQDFSLQLVSYSMSYRYYLTSILH